jgi:hypothetical protein
MEQKDEKKIFATGMMPTSGSLIGDRLDSIPSTPTNRGIRMRLAGSRFFTHSSNRYVLSTVD